MVIMWSLERPVVAVSIMCANKDDLYGICRVVYQCQATLLYPCCTCAQWVKKLFLFELRSLSIFVSITIIVFYRYWSVAMIVMIGYIVFKAIIWRITSICTSIIYSIFILNVSLILSAVGRSGVCKMLMSLMWIKYVYSSRSGNGTELQILFYYRKLAAW